MEHIDMREGYSEYESMQLLAAAVIGQAREDYNHLKNVGFIKDGGFNRTCKANKIDGYRNDRDIERLLEFFRSDQIDQWIGIFGIPTCSSAIRRAIGIDEPDAD